METQLLNAPKSSGSRIKGLFGAHSGLDEAPSPQTQFLRRVGAAGPSGDRPRELQQWENLSPGDQPAKDNSR